MEEKGREHMCLPALLGLFFVAWDAAQHADGMDGSQRFLTTDPHQRVCTPSRGFWPRAGCEFSVKQKLLQESRV